MADSYVCSGAMMRCTMGSSPAKLTVLPSRTVFLAGQPMANISDHKSMVNLAPFGVCRSLGFPPTASATAAAHGHLTPMPCMHNTPAPWFVGKMDYFIKGQPALLQSCKCQCMWGGTISLINNGQVAIGAQGVDEECSEKSKLNTESVLDGIQLALHAAGFVPGFGAVPDLINASISALRGNWADAGMSLLAAVPLIGDAAAGVKIARKGMKFAKTAKTTKPILAKQAKQFIGKNITKQELLARGICKSEEEVAFFNKSLRMERRKVATQFYKTHGMTSKKAIYSHVNGIDLDKPVIVRKIPPTNESVDVYRYMERGSDNSVKAGRYFTDSPKYTSSQLGAADTYGSNGLRTKEQFKFTVKNPPLDCMESTARPIKAPKNGNWSDKSPQNLIQTMGGGKQLYIPIQDLARQKKFLSTAIKL